MLQKKTMASSQNIEVSLCTDDEIPAAFEAMSKGFGQGNAPFLDAYYPEHWTVEGQAKGKPRLLAWKQSAPNSIFLKAALGDTILGLAIWTHMTSPPPQTLDAAENVDQVWPDSDDREYMRRLWEQYVVPRTAVVLESGGKGVMVLELLAVDAAYQQRGAGSALVQWGTEMADERGLTVSSDSLLGTSFPSAAFEACIRVSQKNSIDVPQQAVVEATPAGRRTYEKCGFHVVHEMQFDVGVKFENRKKPILLFMTREARNEAAVS
jgi:GNAT superfamily N-acetyltransferase